MSLPTDVLDYIFSFLESDRVALEACSQSHPFLSQFAERYLYSTIKLQDGGSIRDAAFEFNQLLLDTPRIGSYVRTVEVRIPHKFHFEVMDLTHVSSILPKLSLVKKIALIQEGTRGDFSWENLPETFRQAFLNCLALQSMEELSLVYVINFPLSALKDCKTIKTLQLRNWKHDLKSKVLRDTLMHPLPPVESLSIHSCEKNSLQKMLPWLENRNIRSLSFSTRRGSSETYDFDILPNLLTRCSNHLTTLDLDVKTSFKTYHNLSTREVRCYAGLLPITLSTLLHLEELTIRETLYLHCFPENDWSVSTSIPTIANILKTSSSLKRVSLVLLCHIFNPTSSPLSLASWAPLVRLFTESSVSPFRLHIETREELAVLEILTSFANCVELMELVDKGVLIITPSVSKH